MKIKKLIIPLILGALMLPVACLAACKDKDAQKGQTGGENNSAANIDEIDENVTGTYRTIKTAYEQGLITAEDVATIHVHYTNGGYPEPLSDELSRAIRLVKFNSMSNEYKSYGMTKKEYFDKIEINKYYGKYGDYYAVVFKGPWQSGDGELVQEIAGKVFYDVDISILNFD